MCGILATIGSVHTDKFISNGLRHLSYRGYDSWGIARLKGQYELAKGIGPYDGHVIELAGAPVIAHTRWATNGRPCLKNTQPVFSGDSKIVLAHNGIIDNWRQLDKWNMFVRSTDLDSETIANLLSDNFEQYKPEKAIYETMSELEGSYAVVFLHSDYPTKLFAFCNGSPLVFNHDYIASDSVAFAGFSSWFCRLNDGDILTIDEDGSHVVNNGKPVYHVSQPVINQVRQEKVGHHMLNEICRQQKYLKGDGADFSSFDTNRAYGRVILIGCGSSYYACLAVKNYMQDLVEIPIDVCYASEFLLKPSLCDKQLTLFLCVSQSGETLDVIKVAKNLQHLNFKVTSLTNNKNSTLAQLSCEHIDLNCGPEYGVAATISFTGQFRTLLQLSHYLACGSKPDYRFVLNDTLFEQEEGLHLARLIASYKHVLIFGTRVLYPIALEAALKFKEICYIHAEGLPAAEVKHGPIALIDDEVLSIFFCVDKYTAIGVENNIEQVRARGGKIIVIVSNDTADLFIFSDVSIIDIGEYIDENHAAIASVITLQRLVYDIAVLKGINPDRPRNLAKSVTV